MGSCASSSKIACDTSSSWLEYADADGEPYWYNYITGNYTRTPQVCDWYFSEEMDVWYKASTDEFRDTPPVACHLNTETQAYDAVQVAHAPVAQLVGQVPIAEAALYNGEL